MNQGPPAAFARPDAPGAWQPGPAELSEARLARFVRSAGFADLEELQGRAAADPAWFWAAATDDIEIAWQHRPTSILDLAGGPARARWWGGGAFNHAQASTEPWAARQPDAEALAWEGEDGAVRRYTWAELDRAARVAARRLAGLGIGLGSRVGIFLPMLPETVIAVLALGRLGAVFTPIFSGYAAPAVAARLEAFVATHLITADGFYRRGAVVGLKAVADQAVALAPSVQRVILVRRLPATPIELDPKRDVIWREPDDAPRLLPDSVPQTDPEQPYMVIYTSGTTGRPKGTVHVHGGFPIKAAQDLAHTFDLRAGDALCWFTDLGISPTLIRALRVHGDEPVRAHDRSSLRVLGSTGEPWNPDPWQWLFSVVGAGRLPIVNYSGGTEVSGGIVGCTLLRPIRSTSFNGPCVGMAADIVDASGAPVRGSVGELAIRQPWPGMTRGFWGEPDDELYLDAYWRRQPGTWLHGDWAATDGDGYWYIHGRSDDTLKVAGKRVGPAEVETCAVAHPAVMAAAAIGIPDAIKGEAIVVLCVPRPGMAWDAAIALEVSQLVIHELGKPVRPKAVVGVADLPRTRSGKVMRRVARAAFLGLDHGDLSALENLAS